MSASSSTDQENNRKILIFCFELNSVMNLNIRYKMRIIIAGKNQQHEKHIVFSYECSRKELSTGKVIILA